MKTKRYLLRVSICFLCLFCLSSCKKKLDQEEYFKKYILDPIPKSVKNIKVDQTIRYYGYGYLFGFDINREDLNLIINSKSLKKITHVGYSNGYLNLEYNNDPGGIILPVYGNMKAAQWFDPESWINPDCYSYIKMINHQNDFRILLFNAEENKAYFYIERSRD